MKEMEIGRGGEREGGVKGDSWEFIACDFDSEKDKRNTRNIASVTNLFGQRIRERNKRRGGGERGEREGKTVKMEGSKGKLTATLAALALQFAIAAFGDIIHDAWLVACGMWRGWASSRSQIK